MNNTKEIYVRTKALLEGHFILSSGKHSNYYLQSARLLEYPALGESLFIMLAEIIKAYGIKVDLVCSPALGGVLAGYELARALKTRFIFTERGEDRKMTLRRGFEVNRGGGDTRVLVCEDVVTTGKSARECADCVSEHGGVIVAYAALANRGILRSTNLGNDGEDGFEAPFFALENFVFPTYDPLDCPMCRAGSVAIKPGSRDIVAG